MGGRGGTSAGGSRRRGADRRCEREAAGTAGSRRGPGADATRDRRVAPAGAGHSNREIGEALFISPRTVNFHVTNLLAKLELDSRTAAAAFAVRHGLA